MVLFRLKRIDWPKSVVGANGKRYRRGCELIAEPGSIRRPSGRDHARLSAAKYIGAILYFDNATGQRVWYGGVPPEPKNSVGIGASDRRLFVSLKPYRADNTGRELAKPEAELIDNFVSWLGGAPERYMRGRLNRVSLCVDLFIRSANLLIEAKSHTDRDSIRYAVGQLYDYRSFFARPPRLAVLLPERPTPSILRFLRGRRIHCIWETGAGLFGDSAGGAMTRALRRVAKGVTEKS
ncbi:MAG: hypothetical protein C4576_30665 [Desulfobacteraceae bacterium]|nr:MAG: hypothetical protein C4576_30665 [Desulfobacteraceae bacterium]